MPDRQRLLDLALRGLEAERATIDHEIEEIKNHLNHQPTAIKDGAGGSAATTPRRRKIMSAEARRKISAAMKRRYAAMRKAAKK